ncbi:MAG: J domain-containing protein [Cyanobacteria bacterium P01_G01_bin.54]
MAEPATNHYQTLQVSPGATQAEIKRAYRRLAKQAHPDSQTQAASHEAIVRLNAAYEVLSDRRRRQTYDRERQGQARRRSERDRSAQQQYQQQQAKRQSEGQLGPWMQQIYRPVNHQINQICKPFKQQVNQLAADPFDSDLMDVFVDYVEHSRAQLEKAQTRFRTLPNPSVVAGTAASLYYCLNHLEDGINELEWFTNSYDENYLHTGQEFFRLAQKQQKEAQRQLPNMG